MVSTVELISVRSLDLCEVKDTFVWLFEVSIETSKLNQLNEWTPYPCAISSFLENAFRRGDAEIFIGTLYRIDFRQFLQTDVCKPECTTSIRRHNLRISETHSKHTDLDDTREERLLFPMDMIEYDSTTADTFYDGSPFIRDWLITFTDGHTNVKFNDIFPALINGLKIVGNTEPEKVMNEIFKELVTVKKTTSQQKESKRMKKLEDCCAKLYTKNSFLFRIVNNTMRTDDRTKLDLLGPYCYLVYNYIGRYKNQNMSQRWRFLENIYRKTSGCITLYRGASISTETIEKYKQVAGKKEISFQWRHFLSTSIDRDVAKDFGLNVLFIIEIKTYLCDDQTACLSKNACMEYEKEILIKPGTRFRILKVEFDHQSKHELVYIRIIPSYISNLR